jgi:hypothetical protein
MHAPVAPGWASLVVYVDAAVVIGAAVLAVVVARRRQGAPGGANRAGLAAAALVGWLGIVLALGSAHAFQPRSQGVPWIGLGVGAPIVVGFVTVFLFPQVRRVVESIPQAWLLAAQWPRLVGATFLVLLAEHRLPAVFARPAGWGDVLIGVTALPVAYAYLAGRSWSRPLAVAFNLLGIVDLVVAVGTGLLASPSPFRLFFSQPSTSLMTVLPMVLIPTFLVPFWILVHAASLRALLVAGRAPAHSSAGSRGVAPASKGQFSIGPSGPAWRSGR